MEISTCKIDGVLIFEPRIYHDERGSFLEIYDSSVLAKLSLDFFKQQNLVFSNLNVIRGMHSQESPFEQSKLVTVVKGKILDVVYDMRKDSVTYGETISFQMDDINHKTIFVPQGCAHGYQALDKNTIVSYSVSGPYMPSKEIRLNPLSQKFIDYWETPYFLSHLDLAGFKLNT
jgi:dTDP-4-dehydrorhamnose 3,5-epimerase